MTEPTGITVDEALVDNCPGWSIEWNAATETAHVVKA
jgi:hypothetical protein